MIFNPRQRRGRLQQDYKDLLRIKGRVFDFEAFDPPAPERYILKYKLRSVMGVSGNRPTYSSEGFVHKLELRLPPSYPGVLTADNVRFISHPVFHPNVFRDGRVCIRDYNPAETLARFVLRLAKYIQFDPAFAGPESPANTTARDWYLQNLRLFPVDRSELPDPDRFVFGSVKKDFKFGRVIR